MAHIKNVGGSPGGDDGDRPPPPPSDHGKGKKKVLATKKRKLVDKEVEKAARLARMLDRVEQDDRRASALRIGDSPGSAAKVARATPAPHGSVVIEGHRVSLDDPSKVLPAMIEAEQPQPLIEPEPETESPEEPEQPQEQGLRRLSCSRTTLSPRPEV